LAAPNMPAETAKTVSRIDLMANSRVTLLATTRAAALLTVNDVGLGYIRLAVKHDMAVIAIERRLEGP